MPQLPFVKLAGFGPDLDPTDPSVLTECSFMLPTVNGMKAAASPVPSQLPALPTTTTGATTVALLNGTYRAFVGTPTDLYEQVGSAWSTVTRGSGTALDAMFAAGDDLNAHMVHGPGINEKPGTLPADGGVLGDPKAALPYTGSGDTPWRFAQFGNVTMAVNGADVIQQSNTTGAFSDIPNAPKAKAIDTGRSFVMVIGTTDPTYGERPDAWWCSGIYDQTIWTPSLATQCATGRLIDTPGPNTACRMLGPNFVIYKEKSMYLGQYQNVPVIWSWTVISNNIGTPSQEAVINIGTAHLFLGTDNFYMFDGSRPTPIGDPVKEWFFANRSPSATQRMRSMHDQANSLVYWFFVSINSLDNVTLDRGLVYNYRINKWGRADYVLESVFDNIVGQITYDGMGALYPTYDDLPAVPYNSAFWVMSERIPAIIDKTHKVQTITGIAGNSAFTTANLGDDQQFTLLSYVRLRCVPDPKVAGMVGRHSATLGGDDYVNTSYPYNDGKFDCSVSARWHQLSFAFQGDIEVLGYAPKLIPDGEQ